MHDEILVTNVATRSTDGIIPVLIMNLGDVQLHLDSPMG